MSETVVLTVKRQLCLTSAQRAWFIIVWNCYRYCYNIAIGALKSDPTLDLTALSGMFTPHRQKEAWLQKVHRKIQTAAIQEAIKAFKLAKNHGKGNLKFKKKTEMECRQTIISVERPTISEDRKAVKLPGFGEYVRVLDLREEITADNICSMYKITKEIDESTGETKYFINLSYKEECIEPSPHNENAIGFDRGIKKQLMSAQMITTNQTKTAQTKIETTTTTQEYTTIPEQMKQDELSRDKQKSNMARNKNKKSKRYKRARTEMKRKYKKNANRRADNENKLVLLLCTMFGTIFVENLNLKGMTTHGGNRKRYINRWLRFANHGEFMRKLQYKSLLLGCTLQAVGAAYTSLTCFKCEHASKNNRYKEVFCCTKCGYLDHADRNAACNILRKGLLSFLQTKTVRWVEYPSLNGYVSHLEKLQSGLCISNVPQTFQGFDRFFDDQRVKTTSKDSSYDISEFLKKNPDIYDTISKLLETQLTNNQTVSYESSI